MKNVIICILTLFLVLPCVSKAAVAINGCTYRAVENDTIVSGKISAFDLNYKQIVRFSFKPKANPNIFFELGELQLNTPGQFTFVAKNFSMPVGYILSWNIISKPLGSTDAPGQIPRTEFK